MELRHLRYFIVVAEEQNVSRAAERLHLSQPPLSRQIRDLETEIGVDLFARKGKRLQLTDAGRSFLLKARRIVCDADTAVQQLREEFGRAKRTLRLGFISPVLDDLVAPAVREFRQRHRGLEVSLFDLAPSAQIERLRNHELDVAILGNIEDADKPLFQIQKLWRGKMLAVLPDGHRLAGRRTIRLEELASENWVSLADAFFPGRRRFLQQHCGRAGFEPRIVREADSVPFMLAEVVAGEGVAIMPAHASKLPHAGCALVMLTRPTPMTELLAVSLLVKDLAVASLISVLKDRAELQGS